MQVRGRWYLVGLLVVAVAARGPRPAYAEGERTATLRRAVTNVLLGPLDVALSPVVTVQALEVNARAAGYPWPAMAARAAATFTSTRDFWTPSPVSRPAPSSTSSSASSRCSVPM